MQIIVSVLTVNVGRGAHLIPENLCKETELTSLRSRLRFFCHI